MNMRHELQVKSIWRFASCRRCGIVLTAAVFCRVVNLAAVLFDRFLLIASSSASVNFAPFLRPRGVA